MDTTLTAVTTILTALLALATGYIGKGQSKADRAIERAHARLDKLDPGGIAAPAVTTAEGSLERELLAELHRVLPPAVVDQAAAAVVSRMRPPAPAPPASG